MEREQKKHRTPSKTTPSKSTSETKPAAGTTPSKSSGTPGSKSSKTPVSKSATKAEKKLLGLDVIQQGMAVGPRSADWNHLKNAAASGIRELVKLLLSEEPDISVSCAAAATLILLYEAFPDDLGESMRREAVVAGALALLKGDDRLGQQLAAHIIHQHTDGSAGMLNHEAARKVVCAP